MASTRIENDEKLGLSNALFTSLSKKLEECLNPLVLSNACVMIDFISVALFFLNESLKKQNQPTTP